MSSGSQRVESPWLPGDMKLSYRTVADTGWLLCDGTLVSTTTYAALFANIGHAANGGVDPGGGNFKLPDMRDRGPVGVSATKTRGSTGGAATQAIGVTHLPSHSHGGVSGAGGDHSHGGVTGARDTPHTHALSGAGAGTSGGSLAGNLVPLSDGALVGVATSPGQAYTGNIGYVNLSHTHTLTGNTGPESAVHAHSISASGTHTHTIPAEGGGTALPIQNPYQACHFYVHV